MIFMLNLLLTVPSTSISQESDKTSLNILFAEGNRFFTITGGLNSVQEHLTSNGYNVSQLTTDPSAEDLEGADVFMSFGHTMPEFSSEVIGLISDFVAIGGGLLMNGHSRGLDFGVKMLASSSYGVMGNFYGSNPVNILDHPVTEGLEAVILKNGGGYQVMQISQNGQVVVETTNEADYPNVPVIGVSEYEIGKVMVINALLFTSGMFDVHAIILDNFLSWITSDRSNQSIQ